MYSKFSISVFQYEKIGYQAAEENAWFRKEILLQRGPVSKEKQKVKRGVWESSYAGKTHTLLHYLLSQGGLKTSNPCMYSKFSKNLFAEEENRWYLCWSNLPNQGGVGIAMSWAK